MDHHHGGGGAAADDVGVAVVGVWVHPLGTEWINWAILI